MSKLSVTVVQPNIAWENKTQNLHHLYKLVKDVQQTDIIVLPETFATGFTMNAAAMASSPNGVLVNWMKNLAQEKNAVVTGSLIIEENTNFYNRLLWVLPTGQVDFYNKRHLFSLAGEDQVFTSGTERPVFVYKEWRIMPQICYDLRFPVFARNNQNVDLLLYVASWPARRSFHWEHLLQARAIENQCFVVGANRVGTDGNQVAHCGQSAVYDAWGNEVLKLPDAETVAEVVLNKKDIANIRSKFNFLADQDKFSIDL